MTQIFRDVSAGVEWRGAELDLRRSEPNLTVKVRSTRLSTPVRFTVLRVRKLFLLIQGSSVKMS